MEIPRVLGRSLRLMEMIATGGPGGMQLADAASASGLAYTTSARLARALESVGWLERRRGRWCIGPTALLTVHGGSPAARFRERVLPELTVLVRRTGASATASVLHRGQRLLVAFVQAPGKKQNLPIGSAEAIWSTASGRLLLALSGTRACARFILHEGLPGQAWPQLVDRREVLAELARLRRQGWAIVRGGTWAGMAIATDDGAGNPAVIAMHVPAAHFPISAEPRFLRMLRMAVSGLNG